MKGILKCAAVLGVVALFALATVAGEVKTGPVTLTGEMTCGKCALHKADLKECQDVLVVTGESAGEYYLVKNEQLEKAGHACKAPKSATVTGTVAEKDGKMWLTASKIEVAKKG